MKPTAAHIERIAEHAARVDREEPALEKLEKALSRRSLAERRQNVRAYLLAHGPASLLRISRGIRSSQLCLPKIVAHPWFVRDEDGLWTLTHAGVTGREESCS